VIRIRILVTGGAGFAGKHLVKRLSRNHQVTVLDNFYAADQLGLPSNVTLMNGDVLKVR